MLYASQIHGGIPMLNFKLDTFLALCELRNYTKTAEQLHMTQPAVTQHIQYLEKYYNAKLFYYDERKRLHLTDYGKLLRAYAQTVKADSEILRSRLASPAEYVDEYKIGSLTGTGEILVPKAAARYLEQYRDTGGVLYGHRQKSGQTITFYCKSSYKITTLMGTVQKSLSLKYRRLRDF